VTGTGHRGDAEVHPGSGVDAVLADLLADPEVLEPPTCGWQEFLQRLAHGARKVALASPEAFPLLLAQPEEGPRLCPPLRSLVWVETVLTGLCDDGFSDEAAVAAYRAFTCFLLGHLVVEVATLHVQQVDREGDLGRFPTTARLRRGLGEDRTDEEFEESLELLLDRIAMIKIEQ